MDSPSKYHIKILIYKLLHDTLLLLLLVFATFLAANAMLPGFLSDHLSFTKIIFLIIADLLLILFIKDGIKIDSLGEKQKRPKNYLFTGLIMFMILLIINSLLKFSWLGIAIITMVSLITFFYFYKIFFKES